MALKRQRRARIFQERRNVFEMFGDEHLIKRLHFLSYSKWAKNIITDFSLARVLCDLHCMMNKSLNPYLHCKRLRRITAPRPPELISRAVASFWSGSPHCITKDRHLVYFWQIIIIIISLLSKASATGDIFDYCRYTILSSIGTLKCILLKILYYQMCVECKLLLGI